MQPEEERAIPGEGLCARLIVTNALDFGVFGFYSITARQKWLTECCRPLSTRWRRNDDDSVLGMRLVGMSVEDFVG